MVEEIDNLNITYIPWKKNIEDFRIGDTVKIVTYLELPKDAGEKTEKVKERAQAYEGVIISKHSNVIPIDSTESTITVRKMFQGGGVEKCFVLNSPWIKTIEIIKSAKVKRAKLYYLRERTGKSARLKTKFNTV